MDCVIAICRSSVAFRYCNIPNDALTSCNAALIFVPGGMSLITSTGLIHMRLFSMKSLYLVRREFLSNILKNAA